jgi:hypothetical protein
MPRILGLKNHESVLTPVAFESIVEGMLHISVKVEKKGPLVYSYSRKSRHQNNESSALWGFLSERKAEYSGWWKRLKVAETGSRLGDASDCSRTPNAIANRISTTTVLGTHMTIKSITTFLL